MRYPVSLALMLVAVWLLWSGHYTPTLIGLGVASCLFVVWIATRMGLVDHEGAPVEMLFSQILYIPWLLWEIVKANVDVARRIIDPAMPISPRIIRVKTSQKRDVGRVVYANSITLTPGTISIDTPGDEIVVHALTREAAEGLMTGEMDRRVTRMEGRP